MILNLLATILLATNIGMNLAKDNASNFKAPKKNANTENYTIALNGTNRTTQTYTNEFTQSMSTSNDVEQRDKLVYNSAYLNIKGNIYATLNQSTIDSVWGTYAQDMDRIENNYDNTDPNASRFCYVLQITPYNINVETSANIIIEMVYPNFRYNNGNGINIHRVAYIRNIYGTTTDDWSGYVDRQITKKSTYNITSDIENVDNGFYYTKDQVLKNIAYDSIDTVYTESDTFTIDISPNRTNYYVIEYIPVLDGVYYNVNTGEGNRVLNSLIFSPGTCAPSTITLTGTNIIPTGTYEVVDIPGMMFEILTMPFAFVSQAFNLTLFPGTPYQVNIANLFLSIVAIFVFVWIITIFLKAKTGG